PYLSFFLATAPRWAYKAPPNGGGRRLSQAPVEPLGAATATETAEPDWGRADDGQDAAIRHRRPGHAGEARGPATARGFRRDLCRVCGGEGAPAGGALLAMRSAVLPDPLP